MRLLALLYKDVLLTVKDKAGLGFMLIMPLILVMVMTLLQDRTFKTLDGTKIDLLYLNQDNDTLGNTIKKALVDQDIFNVITELNGKKLDTGSLKIAVAEGDFMIGVIVPENASQVIRNTIKKTTAKAFNGIKQDEISADQTIQVSIFIDPATKALHTAAMMSSLKEFTSKIEKDLVISGIITEVNNRFPMMNVEFELGDVIGYKQEYAITSGNNIIPNSVQHNVPAWTLFAMFFIVISLVGNMINERRQGSYNRLLTMPVSFFQIILSKILVFTVICMIQFALMLLMGVYILPFMGMPSLDIGDNTLALLFIGLASALAAVGYSVMIGVLAKTTQQASSFGSVSVVILSAIGGVWVPIFAMPDIMQYISKFSPLNWGIRGFYQIFIRNAGIAEVFPYAITLILFFAACMLTALIYNRSKRDRMS